MNPNVQTVQYFQQSNLDQRQGGGGNQTTTVPFHSGSTIEFHPTSSGANFHPNTSGTFHTNGTTTTFIPSNVQPGQHVTISQPQGGTLTQNRITTTTIPVAVNQPGQPPTTVQVAVQMPPGVVPSNNQQHIIITTQPVSSNQGNEPDDRRMTAFMEYFVDQQQPTGTTLVPAGAYQSSILAGNATTKYTLKDKLKGVPSEREMVKRAKQAEAARLRYHRLSPEEKKALNLKRTQAQKRKRQREREMAELETILRRTNDIIDDPEVTEQLREKRMRARWAEAARSRYQRMSEEERRAHNTRRRMRQLTIKNEKGEIIKDEDAIRIKIKEQNAKKAAAARNRYHRMMPEEKKLYNQRRTEAFRRRRMEEEALLAMPIGRINGEALDRAQQIVVRNAKRAEAARLRYQRMTPDQRKAYNQKRYTPKRKRESGQMGEVSMVKPFEAKSQTEYDALSSLERDVIKRTQQAQQVLMRQRQGQQPQQQQQQFTQSVSSGNTITTIVPTDPGHSQGSLGSQIIHQQHKFEPHQTILIPQSIVAGGGQQQTHQQVHVQAVPAQQQHQIQYTSNGSIVVQNVQPQQPQIITTYTTQQPQHGSS